MSVDALLAGQIMTSRHGRQENIVFALARGQDVEWKCDSNSGYTHHHVYSTCRPISAVNHQKR